MSTPAVTVNVRHRLGLPARFLIAASFVLDRIGVHIPMRYIIRAVNCWWYVSVDDGPWVRLPPLGVREDLV